MIRKVNSFLYIILYCVIYFSAQILVMVIPVISGLLAKVFTGETDKWNLLYYIDNYMGMLQENTAYLIAASILVSLLAYHIILNQRGIKWKSVINARGIRLKEILAALFFAYGLNVVAFLILSLQWLIPFQDNHNTIMDSMLTGNIWVLFWVVGIIAPVFEEILYRGIILRELKWSMNFFFANLIQALIFGVMHMNVIQGLYAAVIGFVLGYVYRMTGTIYTTMLIHILFNASNIVVSEYVGGSIKTPYFLAGGALALLAGFALICGKKANVAAE